ncbi:MAG: Nif3-like dinuclear metal center hexameric protein [Planctomycetales bacterium]|nr:Nif3-like dinuclear metal center hexameric protein [Planctomycetales bacterium]
MTTNGTTLRDVMVCLDEFAPLAIAEDWDNVGLLVGDPQRLVNRVMTCLTITPATAQEAIERNADLIVSHHPLPFRPLKQITTETTVGRLLLGLLSANIAIYSPHTAFDSAAAGINQRIAEGLGLMEIRAIIDQDCQEKSPGAGRLGSLENPITLAELAARVKGFLKIDTLRFVGDLNRHLTTVAVACGSGGSFLDAAHRAGCDVMVTGEATFHTCLEAEALEIGLLLPGHYASERFALECLADFLADKFPDLTIWPSEQEADPLSSL